MILFHGSPELFDRFDLDRAGDGTGIKFGFGVYLTESEESAVHYSNPRRLKDVKASAHYLYTVEIPDLTPDNHLMSNPPPSAVIVAKVEAKLGVRAPAKVLEHGKTFRKWIGMTRTGSKENGFAEEKAAASLLNGLGVLFNVWPQAQTKPDGLKNVAVFDENNVKILKVEKIDVERSKQGKWVPVSREEMSA